LNDSQAKPSFLLLFISNLPINSDIRVSPMFDSSLFPVTLPPPFSFSRPHAFHQIVRVKTLLNSPNCEPTSSPHTKALASNDVTPAFLKWLPVLSDRLAMAPPLTLRPLCPASVKCTSARCQGPNRPRPSAAVVARFFFLAQVEWGDVRLPPRFPLVPGSRGCSHPPGQARKTLMTVFRCHF